MEEVAHRVYEDHLRRLPPKWLRQLFRHQPEVKPLLVGMALHPAKSFGECLGIAVITTGANLGAAAGGVPRRVRPFYCRGCAHIFIYLLRNVIFACSARVFLRRGGHGGLTDILPSCSNLQSTSR